MEENGTIRGYTIEGGVGLTALVRIRSRPGRKSARLLRSHRLGRRRNRLRGFSEADLVALVHVDDTMALRALLDKMWLAAPNDIASTTTELVLEQY